MGANDQTETAGRQIRGLDAQRRRDRGVCLELAEHAAGIDDEWSDWRFEDRLRHWILCVRRSREKER
jgi:hypothetical protein